MLKQLTASPHEGRFEPSLEVARLKSNDSSRESQSELQTVRILKTTESLLENISDSGSGINIQCKQVHPSPRIDVRRYCDDELLLLSRGAVIAVAEHAAGGFFEDDTIF